MTKMLPKVEFGEKTLMCLVPVVKFRTYFFQIGGTTTSTAPIDLDTSDERLLSSQLEDDLLLEGEVVSSQTITSQSRTIETTTYTAERNGECETRIEQKVTIQSDGEPIDHDEALAQAIQEATAMNPDMTVEKIEIHQTTGNDF